MIKRISQLDEARQLDIVLAEDDPDLATLHQAVLEGAGHHVGVTTDGAETLEAVRESEPDLLILDLEMPRGDGLEVLEELRAEPATVDQPVIVLSNKTLSEGEERRLVRLGVIDFLAKWKVDPRLLVGWIRGWAASRIRRYSPRERRR
ncbi:MAG: response regulator [Candidatus Dormibacteraeota bacterium]|nr:response regulator [Candidatus Dormibacteraeota bacterium]